MNSNYTFQVKIFFHRFDHRFGFRSVIKVTSVDEIIKKFKHIDTKKLVHFTFKNIIFLCKNEQTFL